MFRPIEPFELHHKGNVVELVITSISGSTAYTDLYGMIYPATIQLDCTVACLDGLNCIMEAHNTIQEVTLVIPSSQRTVEDVTYTMPSRRVRMTMTEISICDSLYGGGPHRVTIDAIVNGVAEEK
jgi:hypothetical protein